MLVDRPLYLALELLAWFLALAWLWKAITSTIGMRRVRSLWEHSFDGSPTDDPALTIIVPACNEQNAIRSCIQSLLDQDYPNLHILAVDDRSTDRTGAILDDLAAAHPARVTALHISDLPVGWLGKTHAMAMAARHALALHAPRWLLFTDGDVLFHPQALRRSLVAAEQMKAAHFVTLPTPIVRSIGESMLLGFFQVISFWPVRLWRVADPRAKRDAVGIGAFALIRSEAYDQIGGFEALRFEILEDVSFGHRVKRAGLPQRVVVAPGLVSVHWAAGALGLVDVLTKNLFALFRFSVAHLLAACGIILIFGLAPLVEVCIPGTRLPGLITLLCIASMYRLAYKVSGNPRWSFFLLPFAAILLGYSLLRSMFVTLRQQGVVWRGTFYPLAELRKHTNPGW